MHNGKRKPQSKPKPRTAVDYLKEWVAFRVRTGRPRTKRDLAVMLRVEANRLDPPYERTDHLGEE